MVHWSLIVISLQIFITQCEEIYDPTLRAANPFSAEEDAKVLKKQLIDRGRLADRERVENIWFHRPYEQRTEIANYFNDHFLPNWDTMVHRMVYISTGGLDNLYKFSFMSNESMILSSLQHAFVNKLNERPGAVEEMMCGSDADLKAKIETKYNTSIIKYGLNGTLEVDLANFNKENLAYQNVMQKCCRKGLSKENKLKTGDADKEAKELREIDPATNKVGFMTKLNELLDKYSEEDMKMIFQKYRRGPDDGISDAVQKAIDDESTRRAYYCLVYNIDDPCEFYAVELENAMKGKGCDTAKIGRIVLMKCEQNMGCILKKYQDKYGDPFLDRLKKNDGSEKIIARALHTFADRHESISFNFFEINLNSDTENYLLL